jgi:hypothetical protein
LDALRLIGDSFGEDLLALLVESFSTNHFWYSTGLVRGFQRSILKKSLACRFFIAIK